MTSVYFHHYKEDTPLIRTKIEVPMVSGLERLHCSSGSMQTALDRLRRAASVPKSAYLRRFTCPLNNAHQARVTLLYALCSESVVIYSIKLQATLMPRFYVFNNVNWEKICSVEIKCHCKTSTLQKKLGTRVFAQL